MSEMFVDMGELYERTKEVARAAVAGSPRTSYGLEDVMPEEGWLSVAASPFMSLVPVHATLNGCIDALRGRGVTATEVAQVDVPPPVGMAITVEDMRVARSWLADTLAANVDEDGRQQMVDREAIERDWTGNPTRVTSLVLALVIVAGAAAGPVRKQSNPWG